MKYEDLSSALLKMHGKMFIFSVDPIFLMWRVTKTRSKDPQTNRTNHGTDIIYRTLLSAGLQLSTSIWSWNKRFLYFLYGKSHAIGQYHRHWQRILVANIGYFNKIVEQYNKFKTGWENDL